MTHSLLRVVPFFLAVVALTLGISDRVEAFAGGGLFKLHVVDAKTGQPLAGRLYLRNAQGRPIRSTKIGVIWDDHMTIDGTAVLKLGKGHYQFELECGPEYKTRAGHFEIKDFADDEKRVEMNRFVDLSQEGWWSGDLLVRRPAEQVEGLMRAEDLHVAPLLTRGNLKKQRRIAPKRKPKSRKKNATDAGAGDGLDEQVIAPANNRLRRPGVALLESSGGRLLAFHLGERPVAGWKPSVLLSETPLDDSGDELLQIHLDAPRAASWDLPIWLATGEIDSIGLISSQQRRASVDRPLKSDRPYDRTLYPGAHGAGRWAETIYSHVLESGLRIPPSAASGSGLGKNPPGINRTYVFCGNDFSYANWWENLRAGKVFVSNGPLLRARAGGQLPGHLFEVESGEALEIRIELSLSTREKIEYLEIVRNGKVEHEVRLDQFAAAGGKLPPLRFRESGWFLVRAVTNNEKVYRLACTAPFYVQVGYSPRISRRSVQFFLDWLDELESRLDSSTEEQIDLRKEQLVKARAFWQERLAKANAE